MTTCSDFPSEAMLWIKEVETVGSSEELKPSRSVSGTNFPHFEMLDAKIASALNKIIQNSLFKKNVRLKEKKARFPRGRQIAFMIYDYFESLALMTQYWIMLIYSLLLFMTIIFGNSVQDVMQSSDDILGCLYKLRTRESAQLKSVLELYDMEIHQKISMHNYQKLKTMVKRGMDQKLRLRNFDARRENRNRCSGYESQEIRWY